MPVALRPYQDRAVERIRAAYRGGRRAPLLVSPTGSGKTVVLAYVGEGVSRRGKRVTVIVHRKELVDQVSAALDMADCPHGIIAADYSENPMEAVQVASVDTLVRRVEKNPARYRSDLFIQDEAHHLVLGNKWGRIAAAYPDALYLGVTATPERLSGEGLGKSADGIFDTMIIGPTVRELVGLGFLAPLKVYAPPSRLDLSSVDLRGGDYAKGQLAAATDTPTITGDAVAHYRRLCPGARAITFCAGVEHSKHVAAQFRAEGVAALHVDAETPREVRRAAIADFRSGRVRVLCNVELFGEGFDVPAVEAVIMLRATASLGLFLQMCGRGMRPAEGKRHGLVLDHVGNVIRHGMPDDEREWSLAGRDKAERGARDAANDNVRVRQCPTCYCAHAPAPKCPECGHEYQPSLLAPKQVDGELTEITEADAERLRQQRRRQVGRAQTLEDLLEVAKERGYAPGWARRVFEARQAKRGAA